MQDYEPFVHLTREEFAIAANVANRYMGSRNSLTMKLAVRSSSQNWFPNVQCAGMIVGVYATLDLADSPIYLDEPSARWLYKLAKKYARKERDEKLKQAYRQLQFALYSSNIPETAQQLAQNPYGAIAAATNRNIPHDYSK